MASKKTKQTPKISLQPTQISSVSWHKTFFDYIFNESYGSLLFGIVLVFLLVALFLLFFKGLGIHITKHNPHPYLLKQKSQVTLTNASMPNFIYIA